VEQTGLFPHYPRLPWVLRSGNNCARPRLCACPTKPGYAPHSAGHSLGAHISHLWNYPTPDSNTVFVHYTTSSDVRSPVELPDSKHLALLEMRGDRIVKILNSSADAGTLATLEAPVVTHVQPLRPAAFHVNNRGATIRVRGVLRPCGGRNPTVGMRMSATGYLTPQFLTGPN
jgi:hypothetical protein